jgi:hypothetical protein
MAALVLAASVSAQSYYLENSGRIHNVTQTYAAVNGAGGSLSHAEGSAQAIATGSVVNLPGNVAVTGAVSGFNNVMAFNTAFGSGVGSASSTGWSDATTYGHSTSVLPYGTVTVNGVADGGMQNPVRNGTDASVLATTSQDGFVQASYAGGFAVQGAIVQTPVAGGATVAGIVQDTKYADGQVVAGGVTFSGGTPAGQSAAVRFGNTGVTVEANGSFDDPAHN